ncbi:MAG: hybrid sensor histidine kinase/response regulator [Planctomycetes bacterium]|nr:hybrid sensor histidine kinase/response regulator [Planctomycetota bacterium]
MTMTTTAAVLVVDDDPRNRALLAAFLAPTCAVVEAGSGEAALARFAEREVDLVLLDLVMPGLDGLEVCRRIKAHEGRGFVPVILLTGLADQEHRNAGLEAGADEFVTKPFDRRELLLRVRALLRRREQEQRILEQEARLQAQLDELRHLQAVKDELFGLIVHDVRNPLTGVIGFVDLLAHALRGRDERLARYAERALEGGRRVEEVLGSVLEVQLLESGSVPLHRARRHARAIVEDAVASVLGSAGSVTIEVQADADPVLEADGRLVRRALENLLTNALKYSPPGSAVEVAVRQEGDEVELAVEDRGPGIPDPLKDVVFQKFGSVEARSGHARRGHGLGLHLVKLVASAHGGAVSVRDRDGGGTTFSMRLPLV